MGIRSHKQHALLTDYDSNTAYSEAYHTLFANIRFAWESTPPGHPRVRTLLLATPSVYSDQAIVAANLSIAAAQSSACTILVDADLRAPSLQQRFGLEQRPGLSDLLQHQGEPLTAQRVADCLQATFVPGLQVLGAGTPTEQSAALLHSPKLEEVISCLRDKLLTEAESRPGIVIFHSPPVLTGADASLISALVDQTVLTITVGRTTRVQAKQAQEQLQRAHAKLAGIIMLDP